MPRPMTVDMDAQAYANLSEIELVGAGRFIRGWVLMTGDTRAVTGKGSR